MEKLLIEMERFENGVTHNVPIKIVLDFFSLSYTIAAFKLIMESDYQTYFFYTKSF